MKKIYPRHYTYALLLSLFASRFVFAESSQPANSTYTIPDVVSMALKENAFLISQDARIDEKHFAGDQAKSWFGPSVEFAAGRRSDESNSGPRYEAAFSQPISIAGKPSLRGRLFELESESWKAQRIASEASITSEVIQFSIEYAINRRLSSFVEQRKKRFSLIKSYLEGRLFPSPQKMAEKSIVQNHLKNLHSEALQTQAAFKTSFEKLRVYVLLDSGNYPEIKVPWFLGSRMLGANELMEKTLQKNPDLQLSDISLKIAEVESKLASKDKWPDTKLTASYEEGKATERERNTGVGIGLDFPYWNANNAGIKSADKKKIAEQRMREFQVRQLQAQLPKALIEYEAARMAVKEYPQSLLDDLEAQLKQSEEGFRKGQVDLLTFLELDSSTAETFNRVLESQMALTNKIIDIFHISGQQDIVGQLETF